MRSRNDARDDALVPRSHPARAGKSRLLYLELAIVTILIIVNGLLSMSELAIVSSRPARLAGLVEKGVGGSRRALGLAYDPGKFLATVQIGIMPVFSLR